MSEPCTLITGAASGIGRATACRLAADRILILNDRDGDGLEATLAECARPNRHHVWQYDLSDIESLGDHFLDLLRGKDLVIECLIHCAAVAAVLPMRALEHRIVRKVMNVNVFSAIEIVRLLCSKKVNQGALKDVVLISSIYSIRGVKGYVPYATSKGALDSFMQCLALELAPDVRVNSVLPGAIPTPIAARAFEDPNWVAAEEPKYPFGFGKVDDIAQTVCFLLSEGARWITGQKIIVDGGRTIN